jgi:hypothetical protein
VHHQLILRATATGHSSPLASRSGCQHSELVALRVEGVTEVADSSPATCNR